MNTMEILTFCLVLFARCATYFFGRFEANDGGVVGAPTEFGPTTAKWGVWIAGMNFQTRSGQRHDRF